MLVSHGFWIVQSQCDIFIAGRAFDNHDLGLYAEALFLTQIFAAKFVPPLNEVAFPAYARLQNDRAALSAGFLKAVRLIMLISCPLYLGMAVTAEPLVDVVMGPKWIEAVAIGRDARAGDAGDDAADIVPPALNALGLPQITLSQFDVRRDLDADRLSVRGAIWCRWAGMGLAGGLSRLAGLHGISGAAACRLYAWRAVAGSVLPGLGAALAMARWSGSPTAIS